MNSRGVYRPPSTSKASATTLCQKCLKRDNFECKASTQDRPYVARPSRTQQLLNPKLAPKLSTDLPDDLLQKNGVADAQLAKSAAARGRKRSMSTDDRPHKRSRSVSSFSSSSVSTISTSDSRSASSRRRRHSPMDHMMTSQVESSESMGTSSFERKRRRRSSVSIHDEDNTRNSERNTRRRRSEFSPGERGRRPSRIENSERRSRSSSRSRSRQNGRRRSRSSASVRRGGHTKLVSRTPSPYRRPRDRPKGYASGPAKERSLSPYSKRLALTQALNGGR